MLFDILLKKNKVLDKNNNMILDLTHNTVTTTFINNTRISKVVLVSEDFEMRPDLIALAALGSVNYADVLMKFNSISNPYSIQRGMLIFVPNIGDVLTSIIDRATVSKPLRDIVFNVDKLSKKDKARLKFLEEKSTALKNKGSMLPPNFDAEGNKEVKVKDGKIIFGDNISLPLDKCTLQPISKAAFKSKILREKIRGNRK